MRFRPAAFGLVLYNPRTDAWGSTNLDTRMLLSYEPPAPVGAVRPTRATVELDLTASGQAVQVRRGQCPGGTLTHNPDGPLLADWVKPLGRQVIEFECGPDDVDAGGRAWVLVTVEALPLDDPTHRPPEWQVNAFRMSYVAEVTGPPRPPALAGRQAIVPAGPPAEAPLSGVPSGPGGPGGMPPPGGFRGGGSGGGRGGGFRERPPRDGDGREGFRRGDGAPRREGRPATTRPTG
jgi:hypothetical protein